jgi:DNA-binding LacI/PurR family transcriptional regulator
MPLKRVSITDVAREAGVSRATVSYVLNDVRTQRISPATRDRVRLVAEGLGYQPHAAAVALRGKSPTIALIEVPYWPIGTVVADALARIVTTFEARGHTALLHFERTGEGQPLARACAAIQPAALLAPEGQLTPSLVRTLRASGTRAIVAIGERPSPLVPTLVLAQADLGRVAVRHLADRRYRHVVALMPEDPSTSRFRDLRIAGAREEATRQGLTFDTLLADGDDDLEQALLRLPLRKQARTAIYAYNDELAYRALELLAAQGIRVPLDVGMIGCDDSPLAVASNPQLTSVQLWTASSWDAAADAIEALLKGERVKRVIEVPPPRVAERATT